MTPRSILMVHECFPPDFRGGGEVNAFETARSLIARGVGVQVVTTGDPAITAHGGVPTLRLRLPRHAMGLAVGRIAAEAARHDLVHAYNYNAAIPALAAARRAGRPIACEMLGLFGAEWRQMKGPVLGRLYAAFERVIVTRRYDRTIFCSAPSREAGIAMGADPARSLVVHPGIDTARPAPAATRAPYVLFAGRFDRRKGWHHVVAAARALPDIPFRAFGWGEDIAALRRSAPANLAIADGRSGEGYRAALSEARIFLFPTYAETFGQGVAEAMAGGCAVVSSLDTYRFAGARHAPGDEPAMIRALRRLWDDPAASAAAGEENRRLAAAFTHERHADALLDLYADLLAERGGARRTT